MRSCLLVVLFIVASCTPPRLYQSQVSSWRWRTTEVPIVWGYDCSFPKEYINDVRDGFTYWNGLTDVDVFVEMDGCIKDPKKTYPQHRVITVSWSNDASPSDKEDCGFHALGTAYRTLDDGYSDVLRSAKIVYWKSWFKQTPQARMTIARHEVGHAIGFHHIPYDSCIMYRFAALKVIYPREACPMEWREFQRLYGTGAFSIR